MENTNVNVNNEKKELDPGTKIVGGLFAAIIGGILVGAIAGACRTDDEQTEAAMHGAMSSIMENALS